MNMDHVLSIGSAIVTVAMVTVIVSHPATSQIIQAVGSAFSGSIRAAMGK